MSDSFRRTIAFASNGGAVSALRCDPRRATGSALTAMRPTAEEKA